FSRRRAGSISRRADCRAPGTRAGRRLSRHLRQVRNSLCGAADVFAGRGEPRERRLAAEGQGRWMGRARTWGEGGLARRSRSARYRSMISRSTEAAAGEDTLKPRIDRLMTAVIPFAIAIAVIPALPDVDLWGHIRFGGDIVQSGTIPTADPYSFTSDRSWVNHEWLTEITMYGAYALAGPAGLTFLRLLLIASMLTLVVRTFADAGIRAPKLQLLVAFVAALTYTRT